MSEKKKVKKKVVKLGDPLTKREKEVALMVLDGESNKAIGRKLGITAQTIKNHLSAIYTKLGTINRTKLALLIQKSNGVL